MVGAQQTQARDGEEIRRQAGRIEGQARLCRPGETAARLQPVAPRESLLDERTPPRLFAEVRLLAPHVPGGCVEWADSRRGESQLVNGSKARLRTRSRFFY